MNNESKSDRFRRLVEPRVNKAEKALKLVGNLGNTSLYEMTDKERKKIISHLKNELKKMENNLQSKSKREEGGFSIK
tara:strand:- start:6725 stop:6955 length:231 start_codon:yes stop_codon:yes gene_type:complete